MTGENIRSETRPPRYGEGEISQRRNFGTATSQYKIAGPKNNEVYFDSNAAPTAAPTASHHAPRPVSSTLARKNSTKLAATSNGESGVTMRVPTAAISVTFRRIAAVAATSMPPNRIEAARYTRREIVIAAGEIFRPEQVIGLVEGERRPARGGQPQRHQRQNRKSCVADEPRLVRAHGRLTACGPGLADPRLAGPRLVDSKLGRFIACARRTVRTSRNSIPRPSARRPRPPSTRSAPHPKTRTPRRHWRAGRRCTRGRTARGRAGSRNPSAAGRDR